MLKVTAFYIYQNGATRQTADVDEAYKALGDVGEVVKYTFSFWTTIFELPRRRNGCVKL